MRQAARHADDLMALQIRADAKVVAPACGGRVVVQAQATPTRRQLLMPDPDCVTGADKPVDVVWVSALALGLTTERARPCGYWGAASAGAAVDARAARACGCSALTRRGVCRPRPGWKPHGAR